MEHNAKQRMVYFRSKDGRVVIYKLRARICGRHLFALEYDGVDVMTPAIFETVQRYWLLEFAEPKNDVAP
jgi:hypothetical protein